MLPLARHQAVPQALLPRRQTSPLSRSSGIALRSNNLTPQGLAPIIGPTAGSVLSFCVRLGYCVCLMVGSLAFMYKLAVARCAASLCAVRAADVLRLLLLLPLLLSPHLRLPTALLPPIPCNCRARLPCSTGRCARR